MSAGPGSLSSALSAALVAEIVAGLAAGRITPPSAVAAAGPPRTGDGTKHVKQPSRATRVVMSPPNRESWFRETSGRNDLAHLLRLASRRSSRTLKPSAAELHHSPTGPLGDLHVSNSIP